MKKNIFVQGPIDASFIARSIEQHSSKTGIGAHSIFLGQVRADQVGDTTVSAIEYTTYEEMAYTRMHAIREQLFEKHNLTCLHVYHSLGKVAAGEICLFVFASAPHRQAATDACGEMVEEIKNTLPVWGREIFLNGESQWKVNQPA